MSNFSGDLMSRFILSVFLVASLAACTPPKRVGPPAPIITDGRPAPKQPPHPKPKPPAPPPKQQVAKVYPYRPPAFAPDAPAPRDTVPARESRQAKADPVSKPAPKPTPEPTSEQRTPAPLASVPSKTAPPAPRAVAPAPPAPSLPLAVSTLIKQADQLRRIGDYVGAAANLERALGLQPLEPYIWNRLARVRMEQGRYVQARNLASRSNVLTGGKRGALTRDNRNIIATAQRAAGDRAKARKAQRNTRGG